MRQLVVLVILFLGSTAQAQDSAHCMARNDGPGCVAANQTTDEDGILKPGFHAIFSKPTDRYRHSVLGDGLEWSVLEFIVQGSAAHGPYLTEQVELPENRVFEDLVPRLADMNGDGTPEIIVVETDVKLGAQLAIYGSRAEGGLKKIAATPFIGTRFRWLAPVGIADFNGDGDMDVAYIDRPHLAKILRVWTFRDGALQEIATLEGVTNHLIGQNHIIGGVRDCGDGLPEMIVADRRLVNLIAIRFQDGYLRGRNLGSFLPQNAVEVAMAC